MPDESLTYGQKGACPTKAPCTVSRMPNGTWSARHSSSEFGAVQVSASSREDALTKMRNELQYRIELCPCSGVSVGTVELQVSDDSILPTGE